MKKINKYQFLVGKFPLPMKYLYLYNEVEDDFNGKWCDTAVWLKDAYLKDESIDTIFGQMQLLEIQLEELREKRERLQQEEDSKELKDIEAKIKDKEKSYEIRKQYLSKKTGSNFELLYAKNRKTTEMEFLRCQKAQVEKRTQELYKTIKSARYRLNSLEEKSNYYSHLSVRNYEIEEQEQNLYNIIKEAEEELREK